MKLTDKIKIGDEVENSAPDPVNPTDLVRLQDLLPQVVLTQAEYNVLTPDPNTLYFIY